MSCNIDLIAKAADKCAYVKENCHMEVQIPFTQIFYCNLNENLFVLMFIGITLCFVVFHFLSVTVDNYLAKSLTNISRYFNMSQTLAGVTLVALGNGSADLMGAFVSVDANILVSVGSIFGGVLFITTFVFARVLQFSGEITLNGNAIKRDVIFNMIGTSCIIIFASIGYINHIMSAFFVGLYFIYIIVVLNNERTMKNEQKELQEKQHNKNQQEIEGDLIQDEIKADQKEQDNQGQSDKKSSEQKIILQESSPIQAILKNPEQQSLISKQDVNEEQKKNYENSLELEQKSWQEMTNFEKFIYVYDYPFDVFRKIFIPQCDQSKWNKTLTLIHCFTFPPTVLYLTQLLYVSIFNIKLLILLWILTGLFAIYVQFKSSNNRVPEFFIILMFSGAFIAIFIIKICVEAIVDFLLLFQILTGISYTYIGMTVLALGNSIADYCTNLQLAKMGYGIMAVTACFAGCIFNVLLGFGLALVKVTWLNEFMGKIDFKLFQDSGEYPTNATEYDDFMNNRYNNSVAVTLLLFAITNSVVTFVIIQVKNYRLTSSISSYYFIFYGSFLFMVTTMSILLSLLIKYNRPEYFW